jgi:hypothetical protein
MEYDGQSHHPIIVSLATGIAPYNDESYCKFKCESKMLIQQTRKPINKRCGSSCV